MQYTIYLILAPLAGVFAILAAIISWQRRKGKGFGPLTWLMISITGFLFTNFFELITPRPDQTLFWVQVSYIFIPLIPLFWIRFALDYSGHYLLLQWKYFWVLCVVPAITTLCAFEPSLQYLLWKTYNFKQVGDNYLIMVVSEHGLWFWVYSGMGYLLLLVGMLLIFKVYIEANNIFRKQSIWILIGTILPVVLNLIYVTHAIPGLTKDFSPIGYCVAGLCFTIGMIRYQLLDLMPVARATLVDEIADGVVVLDADDHIVDINPAARKMLALPDSTTIGSGAEELFTGWGKAPFDPTGMNVLTEGIEVCVRRDRLDFWFLLRVSPLRDGRGRLTGRLLMIHDITDRNRARQALQEANREMEQRVVKRTAELAHLNATLEERISNRTRELSALYELATLASQSVNNNDLIAQTLSRSMSVIPSLVGAIYLLDENDDPDSPTAYHLAAEKGVVSNLMPLIPSLPSDHPLTRKCSQTHNSQLLTGSEMIKIFTTNQYKNINELVLLAAPMQAENRMVGVIILANEKDSGFKLEDVKLLSSIASHTGLVILSSSLRQRASLYEANNRLSNGLHDTATLSLDEMIHLAEVGQAQFEQGQADQVAKTLAQVAQTARQILKGMHLYIYDLHPPILNEDGLVDAIQTRLAAVKSNADIATSLTAESDLDLPLQVTHGLYHIACETLNNILRHAHATEIRVSIKMTDKKVVMEISDNGDAFDPKAESERGMGLHHVKDRAKRMNGDLLVRSIDGKGTLVRVTVKTA